MARQEKRTARKDYPESGVKAGDTYYFAQVQTGPRSSRTIRSLNPIPQSQLTTSPFKSGWYAMQEAWEASAKDSEAIMEPAEVIRELGNAAQESFENMPEGLQQGDTGQMLEARASACEEAADQLESQADVLNELEEPVEPLGDLETEEENAAARETYEDELADYESTIEAAVEEADGLIGDMPE